MRALQNHWSVNQYFTEALASMWKLKMEVNQETPSPKSEDFWGWKELPSMDTLLLRRMPSANPRPALTENWSLMR